MDYAEVDIRLGDGKFLQYLTDKRTYALLAVATGIFRRLSGGEFGFAEDFRIVSIRSAAAAVGDQLPRLGKGEPVLVRRDDMARRLGRLREQRTELEFAIMLDDVRF